MGMTIDDCIDYYNRSFAIGDTASDRQHNDVLEMTISTMRKYQKIKEIYDNWNVDFGVETHRAMNKIGEVLKDGNDD